MPRFFTEHADPDEICLTGEDAHHIGRSLRMRPGEQLTVCACGTDYLCEITKITEDAVYLHPVSIVPCASEPMVQVTLYQAVPKRSKIEEIIQKSVELGVFRIVPVLTARCVARPSAADFERKRERLQKISQSAAKQSGRGIVPEVAGLLTWQEALAAMQQEDAAVMLYEEQGGMRFGDVPLAGCKRIGLFIGSEGGISEEEAAQAQAAGIHRVWLGRRILRCETAPVAAMGILMYLTGEM